VAPGARLPATHVLRIARVVGGEARRYPWPVAILSRGDVEHVAHLARLGLSDDEVARLAEQLNDILDQYAILAEVDTDDIPPTAQVIELENILRDDEVRPSLPLDSVLANAPEVSGDHIVVPAVLGEARGAAETAADRRASR
jgi:aspartyl-tRNA(Asn)/glutamyl-tRNA(Gln) amidotransferase subunit C